MTVAGLDGWPDHCLFRPVRGSWREESRLRKRREEEREGVNKEERKLEELHRSGGLR
jgi:hypothetical protein